MPDDTPHGQSPQRDRRSLPAHGPLDAVSLREYFEGILNEQRRGMVLAEQEREKSAQALAAHLEQRIASGDDHLRDTLKASVEDARRGLMIAEQEREKAASALRVNLEQTILEGDRNLREHIKTQTDQLTVMRVTLERNISEGDLGLRSHIESQVEQIRAALVADAELQNQRYVEVKEKIVASLETGLSRLTGVQREIALIQESAAAAIAKAESANEKRFASVNEFREQLTDQAAAFLPREVAESQFLELRQRMTELAEKVNKLV